MARFCGDTLLSAGCGWMFEGNPEQMNASLKLAYGTCLRRRKYFAAVEYTAANLRFALAVELANGARPGLLQESVNRDLRRRRSQSSVDLEPPKSRSIPLRCDKASVRIAAETHAGKPLPNPREVFGVLARLEDPVPLMRMAPIWRHYLLAASRCA